MKRILNHERICNKKLVTILALSVSSVALKAHAQTNHELIYFNPEEVLERVEKDLYKEWEDFYVPKNSINFYGDTEDSYKVEINRNGKNIVTIETSEEIKFSIGGIFFEKSNNLFEIIKYSKNGEIKRIVEDYNLSTYKNESISKEIFSPKNNQKINQNIQTPRFPNAFNGDLNSNETFEITRNGKTLAKIKAYEKITYSAYGIFFETGENNFETIQSDRFGIIEKNFENYNLLPNAKPIIEHGNIPLILEKTATQKEDTLIKKQPDITSKTSKIDTPKEPSENTYKSETAGDSYSKEEWVRKIREEPFEQPSEDDEMYVQIIAGKTTLDRTFPIRMEGEEENIYVPIGMLAELLSLDITVDKGRVYGWVLEPTHLLDIDLKRKIAKGGKNTVDLLDGDAFEDDNEIFVEIGLLSHLLPFDLKFNIRTLTINILSSKMLPFEQKQFRRGRWEQTASRSLRQQEKRPKIIHGGKYSSFTIPSVDLNQSFGHSFKDKKTSSYTQINTANDFLYGTISNEMTFNEEKMQRMRLTYSRIDEDGGAIPFLGATQLTVGDIRIDGISSFATSKEGVGFAFKNTPLGASTTFSTITFEGEVLPGWDVELYRNKELVAFFDGSEGGRYLFEDITVIQNGNLFEIVKYGPHGEVETTVEKYLIPFDMVSPEEWRWSFSGGLGEAALENANTFKNSTPSWHAKIERGINHFLSLSFENQRDIETKKVLSAIGGTIAVKEATIRQRILLEDTKLKGLTSNISRRIFDASINLAGEKFFLSAQDKKDAKLNLWNFVAKLNRRFSSTNTSLDYQVSENAYNVKSHKTRLGLQKKVSNWMVSQIFGLDKVDKLKTYSANTTLRSTNIPLNPSLEASIRKPQEGEIQSNIRASIRENIIQDKWSSSLSINLPLQNRKDASVSGGIAGDIGKLNLGFSSSIARNGNASINFSARIGFGFDSKRKAYHKVPYGISNSGGINANVSLLDDGDKKIPLKGAKIHGRKTVEGQEGDIIITGLEPGRAQSIILDTSSLDDPLWTPMEEVTWIRPRAGVIENIDMTVVATGEIEGNIWIIDEDLDEEIPLSGIEMMLVENKENGEVIAKVRSEFDGYYMFDRVRPGSYLIVPNPNHIEIAGSNPLEEKIIANIKPGGEFVDGLNISLTKKPSVTTSVRQIDTKEEDFDDYQYEYIEDFDDEQKEVYQDNTQYDEITEDLGEEYLMIQDFDEDDENTIFEDFDE